MNNKYFKVRDHRDLLRDANSKALINKDSESLNKYREERDQRMKLAQIANDYDTLKGDVEEIKTMLKLILERNGK